MEEKIKVVIKRPREDYAVIDDFPNTLEAFQAAVGGRIETFTFAEDCTVVCNEDMLINDLPFNCTWLNQMFFGTILFVGVDGDEFCSLSDAALRVVTSMMEGVRRWER